MKKYLFLATSVFMLSVNATPKEDFKTALQEFSQGNMSEGLVFLKKSANDGYADAKFNLGDLYTHGAAGLEKDYDKALEWTQGAADSGMKIAKDQITWLKLKIDSIKETNQKPE